MDALFVSTGIVALAEIGDKTQLLAIVLAAKYRQPLPIILGILAATLANHALAAWAGVLIAGLLTGQTFQIVVGTAFIAMAGWALIPDAADDEAGQRNAGGVFLTTLIAFFFVEMGDKTQVATALLGARFQDLVLVTAGTTLGMMLANIPAVVMGERITRVVPLNVVRVVAALVFAAIGIWIVVAAL